ncbi:MAG: PD-(D/E)XK nuclease family protein [Acidobacteria bacterium]|nr:PD-(D/E)XK nuclease family protein [Acidobacteriota bacterium]
MFPTGAPIYHGTYAEIAAALGARIAAQQPGARPGEPVEIIVPSRSAAEEVARRAIGDGGAIAGLRALQVEQFALRVLNDGGIYPRLAESTEASLAMELALRSAGGDLSSIHGAAPMLLRTHRDVRDSGVSLAELSRRITKHKGLHNRDRLVAALAVWKRYESLLSDAGATVEADALTEAAARIRAGALVAPQIVFGFYDATEAQLDLLRTLAAAGRVDSVWIPAPLEAPAGSKAAASSYARPFIEAFSAHAVSRMSAAAAESAKPAWDIRSYRSPASEIREVCREIKRLLDAGVPSSSCAVVMRSADTTDLELIERAGNDFGLSFRGTPGPPLAGNRIVRGILSLLRIARGGMQRRDVMEVVRSGVRPGALGTIPELSRLERATRRAKIARASAEEVRAIAISDHTGSERPGPDGDLLGYALLVERLARLTKKASTQLRGSAWAEEIERWINLFEVETEDDVASAIRLRRVASLFERDPFAASRLDADDVRRAIDGSGELGRDENAAAIWAGDVMRFRGRTAEHLFVLRATHDKLPQRRVDDPLLTDSDRVRLGVRTVGDGREEERFLFESLVASARGSIHFSFPAADGVGKALRPSAMLKDFAIDHLPTERREILHDFSKWLRTRHTPPAGPQNASERRAGELLAHPTPQFVRQLQLAAMHGGDTPFDGYLAPGSALEARVRSLFASISPSIIEQLGECPQRFFLAALIGARELEEPDAGIAIESREKGTLDHLILERFYRSLASSDFAAATADALSPALRARLAEEVGRAFDELDAKTPPQNRTLRAIERAETLASLAELVRSDMRQLAEGDWLPQEYEKEIDSRDSAARIDAAGVAIGVRGRIDRIDRRTDGSLRVVDYKSGKGNHLKDLEKKIAAGEHLQTAIYALVVRRVFGLDPAQVSARILPLRDPEAKPEKFSFNLGAVEETLTGVLDTLVGAAMDGRFPAVPSIDACKYCLIRHWCRERHVQAGEQRKVLDVLRGGSA